ncbi:MAG: glucosaminidase domain-containing protein, partial [Gammaproteobacteria bacterium]|nr:glucosaminidase domain-containing protein [Gammaproteobacteria bacterium]
MLRKTVVIIVLLSIAATALAYEIILPQSKVELKQTTNLTAKQKQFVEFMLPKIDTANHEILMLRKQLVYLHFIWQEGADLNKKQTAWLHKLAHDYRVTDIDLAHRQTWNTLLNRVDGLPDSLILAQAINESGWGSSRFAKKGNNYFGVWCTSPGCGIVPRRRAKGATHEVRTYATALDSVEGYMQNINVYPSYRKLRNLREQIRFNHAML